MSTTQYEDIFAAELRALADAEQPSLDLDPVATLHGGRVLRRRRAARNGAVTVLAAAAVALGIAQISGFETPDTGPAQEPRTFGTEQSVELAPGVIAANLPREIEVDDTKVFDLGYSSAFGETGAQPGPSYLEVTEPVGFEEWTGPGADPVGALAELGTVYDDELWRGLRTLWVQEDSPEMFLPDAGAPETTNIVGLPVWSFEQHVLGSVPSWIEGPQVLAFSERGFLQDDGSVTHALEIPTFRAPTSDERLLFAFKITEEQGRFRNDEDPILVDAVIFRGADGSVWTGRACDDGGLAGCIEKYGDSFRQALGLDSRLPTPAMAMGNPLTITTIDMRRSMPVEREDIYEPIETVPSSFEDGTGLLLEALTEDGRVLVTASDEGVFDGDKFLEPERMGLWGPEGFELFDDTSALTPGDPFRYAYFATVDGSRAAWVETASTQGAGRWRIFSRSADAETRLVAMAEDGEALGHDFGGDIEPAILGERVVWTTEVSFVNGGDEKLLVSAPLDGSAPLQVETAADSQPAVGEAGAYFARDGGREISLLRSDGEIVPVLSYAFTERPYLALFADGSVLVVRVALGSGADRISWLDAIDLSTGRAVRVTNADPSWAEVSVCGKLVVWAELGRSDEDDEDYWSTSFLDVTTGTLRKAPDTVVGNNACAGGRVLISEISDPETMASRRLVASLR